jgi:hypothetical protein
MQTKSQFRNKFPGGQKMKPLRSVLRIMVSVSAVVVFICTAANAASKQGSTPMTSKMTGSHKATLKNGSLPHAASLRRASLPHIAEGSSPEGITPGSPELAAPESALGRSGMERFYGDNYAMPHVNGYFMRKHLKATVSTIPVRAERHPANSGAQEPGSENPDDPGSSQVGLTALEKTMSNTTPSDESDDGGKDRGGPWPYNSR